jgi:DNA-binding transcriptional LysR family regulator
MSLDKMKRVAQLWSWLPTFRAAGETQHLSEAGAVLGISTSAVSRAVRLLEEDIGHPLFERVGRNVRLNESGRAMLNAVRIAMRVLDEALRDVEGGRLRGPVRVAADEPMATLFLLPALDELRRAHPMLAPAVERAAGLDLAALLRRGDIDLVVGPDLSAAGLESEWLGRVTFSDYVGPQHPWAKRRSVELSELRSAPRAALRPALRDRSDFTPHPSTKLLVDDIALLLHAVNDADYVALLPDAIAARHPEFRRIRANACAPIDAFVARRQRLDVPTRADAVVEAMLRRQSAVT